MNETVDKDFADELMATAATLATEVPPERELWPGIEQAISQPARPAQTLWNNVWARAAVVVLLIGGSSGVTYLALTDDAETLSPGDGGSTLIFEPVSASFGGMYQLGPGYQDARRSLAVIVDEELNRLSPEARAAVQKNLELIRAAIEDINKSLAAEPDNALLQKLLLNTYREELDLMMRVNEITSAAMRRGDI